MNTSSIYQILPYILIISSFGPYIIPQIGVRLEHIFLYLAFAIFLYTSLLKNKIFIKDSFLILIILLETIVFLTIRTLGNNVSILQALADFESVVQPFVIMFFFSLVLFKLSKLKLEERLITASKILILMLSLNTIWSIFNIFLDLTSINIYFWGAEESVATRAMTNGRYSGIFNQPMEAGAMYSLGLLSWIYISEKINVIKFKYIIGLFLMIIGGILSVSKVFLFGGIGLFIIGVFLNKRMWKMIVSLTIWSILIGTPTYYFLIQKWSGVKYLTRFFDISQDLLMLLTSGRFGENSQQLRLFEEVWRNNPLIGSGFGVQTVYDSGFFYFFGNGGLIGLSFYLLILITFVVLSIHYINKYRLNAETKFFTLIVILIIASSIGAPILTLNRVSTVLWVLIGLLIQYFYYFKIELIDSKSLMSQVVTDKLNGTVSAK